MSENSIGGPIVGPSMFTGSFPPATQSSFSLAPGTEIKKQTPATTLIDYTLEFPELPTGSAPSSSAVKSNAWVKPPLLKSTVVTQVFHLPVEERAHKDYGNHFGDKSSDQTTCNEIAGKTNTTIELSESKDRSLTIVVTGKRSNVEEARKLIVQGLQSQASREIRIAKEYHRSIVGKEGKRLQEIEKETDCTIKMPGRDVSSDIIRISGPREGIDKAVHRLHLISDEQSKLAQEHLMIQRIYYPWIRNSRILEEIQEMTKVRINIPPPTANSEVIVVTGEKEGVHKAAAVIRQIHEEKLRTVKAVTCTVNRAQHRFVIGQGRSGLTDILNETGVSVEVPPEEAQSDTITLRGDPDKLGQALAMVYQKASSVITAEVQCPAWLHKFIIGQRGANIRQIVGDQSKLQVDFDESGVIYLEGAPEEVKRAQEALTQLTKTLQMEMETVVVRVAPNFHRHIIGRQGAQISKIKQETGVSILIPDESTNSDEIRIEGKKEGVRHAAAEIMEIAKRLENEKSKDVLIEQRFHKQIIGPKGETIRELRDKFPGVNISFPEPGRKSDVVSLRGPRDEVEKMAKHLLSLTKEMQESNFQVHVPIFKDFHKHIIGKGGATIKKIREETETRIDLPAEDSGEDSITVTGKKANVEKAVAQLQKIQNELASIVTIEISIPQKIHPRLIGNGGRLLHDISEQCGGAQIRFPPEASKSDKVTIRGPKEEAEKAQKLLADLAKDRELSSHQEDVKAKPEQFRFLIGRGGTKIKKVREAHPDVRILFPRPQDQDQETIHIIGKKEEVGKVRKKLEELIAELNEIEEITMDVDPKWHRHFVARSAMVTREVQDQCGGVIISFPKAATNSSKVSIKGAKECVMSAKKRIEEIVSDLEAQITIHVPILAEHHRILLSNRGQKIQDICAKHNVNIKFPERAGPPGRGQHHMNGDEPKENGDESKSQDMVAVTGRPEHCEAAKKDLMEQVPITKTLTVPFDFHKNLIGKGGEEIRRLMTDYDVNIKIPSQEQHSDEIQIYGCPSNVKEAIECIKGRVVTLEGDAKDRQLRSFQLKVEIPAEYHSRIIGPRGQTINEIRKKYGVQIKMPGGRLPQNGRASNGPEVVGDEILITGYENDAQACKAELESMIQEYQSLFVKEITLDSRIHPRIIGQKGRTIQKIMDQYGVEIRFPRNSDPDPNLVSVSGKSEDAVYDCVDHLQNLEEEYLQDIADQPTSYYREKEKKLKEEDGKEEVKFVNAPWHHENQHEFPSLGGSDATSGGPSGNGASFGVWGPKR